MHHRYGQFPGYTVREALDSPRHYEWYLATEISSQQWVTIKALSRDLCNVAELKLFSKIRVGKGRMYASMEFCQRAKLG